MTADQRARALARLTQAEQAGALARVTERVALSRAAKFQDQGMILAIEDVEILLAMAEDNYEQTYKDK